MFIEKFITAGAGRKNSFVAVFGDTEGVKRRGNTKVFEGSFAEIKKIGLRLVVIAAVDIGAGWLGDDFQVEVNLLF